MVCWDLGYRARVKSDLNTTLPFLPHIAFLSSVLAQNLNPVVQISKRFKLIGFCPNKFFEGDAVKFSYTIFFIKFVQWLLKSYIYCWNYFF